MTIIPVIWEEDIERIMVQGQPGQKVINESIHQTQWCPSVIPAVQEAESRRSMV
jgi:hypothetical protein